ncbi:probable dehydrogenase [Phialocephala subalpina]|uniref:Probable dehydrogenase n=1 Tax=Phialocephala subalpina TaxID=576137 RepID=A0A1L7XW77_9HELO|nr:probable dehydrogenase [Phialocephala subalpina]
MASAMAKRLEGKTILITGASSGIGRSTAFEFARTSPKSLRLVLTARRFDTLQKAASEINKEVGDGVKIFCHAMDVGKPEDIDAFMPSLPEEFRDIDILFNNAGLAKGGMVGSPHLQRDYIDEMFATNVTGLMNMTQAILPIFLARPDGGHGDIIMMNSVAGREAYVGGSIYCATKAAVRSYTEILRKELIATRIRVIEIAAGQVETEFSVVRYDGDKAKADAVYAGAEPCTPEDIAEVVVFAAGRRENMVLADALLFPNHQATATILHRKT